jgi:hypothetical protein
LAAIAPGKLGLVVRLRSAAVLSRRWMLLGLTPADGLARALTTESLPLEARPDGVGCRFYTSGFAELLRLVAGVEGAMVHEACRGLGDRHCIWRAERAEGY